MTAMTMITLNTLTLIKINLITMKSLFLINLQNPQINSCERPYNFPTRANSLKGESPPGNVILGGHLIGTENNNLIIDTHQYDVEFGKGDNVDCIANTIIKNLHNQVDNHGQTPSFLKNIFNFGTITKLLQSKVGS